MPERESANELVDGFHPTNTIQHEGDAPGHDHQLDEEPDDCQRIAAAKPTTSPGPPEIQEEQERARERRL